MNRLHYGDNLQILRQHIEDESVDLIYLDPPFNSNANYNVLFRSPAGERSHAQIEAFEDSWHWTDEAEQAFDEVMQSGNTDAAELLRSLRAFLKENDMMAYLAMMAARLLELHRVLKPTGSLYLHCDPTASHYLKLVMDAVFGLENFRSEITWRRTNTHNDSKSWSAVADILFYYVKSRTARFVWKPLYQKHSDEHVASKYKADENGRMFTLSDMRSPNPRPNLMYEWKGFASPPNGWAYSRETMKRLESEGRIWYPANKMRRPRLKRFLDEMKGTVLTNIWTDIHPINSRAQERLGYPTQKPVALLERIIAASSNEGDIILDPFCGCGTTIHAAQKLNRQWIGIDITNLAISLIEKRLTEHFPGVNFQVCGTPKDLDGARELAAHDKYQFQWWAVSLVKAIPYGGKKKGADSGIDGLIYFKPEGKTVERAIVSVKGGDHVGVSMIRDLAHVVKREKAQIGLLISLAEATRPMLREAVKEGFYDTGFGKFPRIQILAIQDLLSGKMPQIPLVDPRAFKVTDAPSKGPGRQATFEFSDSKTRGGRGGNPRIA